MSIHSSAQGTPLSSTEAAALPVQESTPTRAKSTTPPVHDLPLTADDTSHNVIMTGGNDTTSTSVKSSAASSSIAQTTEAESSLDIEREVQGYCMILRTRLQDSWNELQRLEVTLSKTKHRLNKHNLQDDVILSQSAAWQRAQAEDMQDISHHLHNVELCCGDAYIRSRMLRQRIG